MNLYVVYVFKTIHPIKKTIQLTLQFHIPKNFYIHVIVIMSIIIIPIALELVSIL